MCIRDRMKKIVANGLYGLTLVLLVAFLVGTVIVVFNTDSKIETLKGKQLVEYIDALNFVEDSMSLSPIKQIVEISASEANCPASFSKVVLGSWPGLIAGCIFEEDSKVYSECRNDSKEKILSAVQSAPINFWRTKTLCIQRYEEPVLFNVTECPEGYTECLNQGVCVQQQQKGVPNTCPVNKFQMTGEGNFNFVYDKSVKGEPLINILASITKAPCVLQDRLPDRANPYPLYTDKGCGNFGDKSKILFQYDQITESEMLNDNLILGNIKSSGALTPILEKAISAEKVVLFGQKKVYPNSEKCKNMLLPSEDELNGLGGNYIFFLNTVYILTAVIFLGGLIVWLKNRKTFKNLNLLYFFAILIFCPIFVTGVYRNYKLVTFYFWKYIPFVNAIDNSDYQQCFTGAYDIYGQIFQAVGASEVRDIFRSIFFTPAINTIVFASMIILWIIYECVKGKAGAEEEVPENQRKILVLGSQKGENDEEAYHIPRL
eukprot:TRINITY_DN3260_c0_g1_i1.p1 TRINITY_DN3260_c0_g1~~TRINITY_DN3260_c0_g1_i1.p1  ORF type:complete len:514 (+),score=106.16 TRINITY_DN3260_c0_g1_i1:76-1542(+)